MFRVMLMFALSMGMAAQAAEEFTAAGTVNAVRLKEQKINITHEAIAGLTGEATRDFAVLDPGMLEEVKVGNRLKFSINQEPDGELVIIDFEVVAAPLPRPVPKKK